MVPKMNDVDPTRPKAAGCSRAPAVRERELTAGEWFERGFNTRDPDEQIRCYGEAIRLKPDYADAFFNRADAREAKGDLEGAIQDYDETIRLKPNDVDTFYKRADARQAKGDLKGAMADFQSYLELGGGERDRDRKEVEDMIRDLKGKLAGS